MNDNTLIWLAAGLAIGWYFGKSQAPKPAPCDCEKPSAKGVGGMLATGQIAGKACAKC